MNINDFKKKKESGEPIVMITAYDSTFANIIEGTNADVILVGDSLAMVMHGQKDTTTANMEMMKLHTSAVASKIKTKFLVADMPFMSFRKGLNQSVENAESLIRAGAHAVKLEGADGNLELVQHLVESGIPVMGHLGLTPQFIHAFGGWKVQGKKEEAQTKIFQEALALQKAGCFSLVLECVPSHLAKKIQQELDIPCIGIGAGKDVAGQVLVLQDLLGLQQEFKPKFVKTYMNGYELVQNAINHYSRDVKSKEFPTEEESYK